MVSIPVLADKGITVWWLDGKPTDPFAPTAEDINGQNIECVLGRDFNIGSTTPQTTDDGPLCQGAGVQVPTGTLWAATMSAIRKYDPTTRQIHVADDAFYQAAKELGSELWIAVRDGGKNPLIDPDAEEGDEVSIYRVLFGQAGRSSDRAGYQKRQLYPFVQEAFEDVWVGGTEPVPTPPVGG